MSGVRFDDAWQYNGCRVLRLENELLRVDVLPELGGKILHLVHKPEDRDYLWQHPVLRPTILPNASNYDDNFCGGWDDCFPNVAPGTHAGEAYPDHGEFWTRRFEWDVDRSDDDVRIHLHAFGHITRTHFEKWITLSRDSTSVRIRHRITHLGGHPFDYLWAQHPAVTFGFTDTLVIPAQKGIIGSPGSGRLAAEPLEFTWPHVPGRDGQLIDCSKMPISGAPGYEMLYLTQLKAGWYAILNRATHSGLGLAFDHHLFNTLWFFASYGGWRGLNVVILEPCTGWPYDLAQAAANGNCGRMEPGQTIETHTSAVVFTDRDTVSDINVYGIIS